LTLPQGIWDKIIDSSSEEWGGPGSISGHKIESFSTVTDVSLNPHSFVLYRMSEKRLYRETREENNIDRCKSKNTHFHIQIAVQSSFQVL